jgi:hypothetical protein
MQGYVLPESVLSILRHLESCIVVPPQSLSENNTLSTSQPSVRNHQHHHNNNHHHQPHHTHHTNGRPQFSIGVHVDDVPMGGLRNNNRKDDMGGRSDTNTHARAHGRSHYGNRNTSNTSMLPTPPTTASTEESWLTAKAFQPTKLTANHSNHGGSGTGGGVDKLLQEIRIALNKISPKSYDAQSEILQGHVQRLCSELESGGLDDRLKRVATMIFDVASVNKMYHELYAKLYKSLLVAADSFKHILYDAVTTFVAQFPAIEYKDPNEDYDEYCRITKQNDKRRALGMFFVSCANQGIIESSDMAAWLHTLQAHLMTTLTVPDRTNECEEMATELCTMVGLWNAATSPTGDLYETITQVAKWTLKEAKVTHPSITSRILFIHMDVVKKVCK